MRSPLLQIKFDGCKFTLISFSNIHFLHAFLLSCFLQVDNGFSVLNYLGTPTKLASTILPSSKELSKYLKLNNFTQPFKGRNCSVCSLY